MLSVGSALAGVVGLAEGIAVGTAFVAFIVALDVVPHLARLTGTMAWSSAYEWAIAAGMVVAALDEAHPVSLAAAPGLVVAVAAAMGMFFGMVSAGLAEVLGVLPVLTRRLGLVRWLAWLVAALILGKTAGAMLWWLVPTLWGRPPAG